VNVGGEKPEQLFPKVVWDGPTGVITGGITLRDYFAANAMVAILSVITHPQIVAERAYEMADAMLAKR
jgi:hypothetical protein